MTFEPFKGVDASTVMLAAAGAAGGLYRWIVLRPKLSDGLISVASGAIAASIFGPILSPVIVTLVHAVQMLGAVAITEPQALPVGGFLAGLLGISVSGFLIDFFRAIGRVLLKRAKSGGNP